MAHASTNPHLALNPTLTRILSLLMTITAAMAAPLIAGSAEPKEILLWPADHPANQGAEPAFVDTPEWMTRVTKSPAITPFLPEADKRTGAACIICPGGGYAGLSMEKEGLEPAKWMSDRGVAAFVLRYRCGGGKNQQPVPKEDVQRAIRMVRSRAAEWNVDPKQVGVLGFSAGGHLASTAATHFDAGKPDASDPIDRQGCRPDFQILIYPVITMMKEVTHLGSRQNLLGDDPVQELVDEYSNDLRVTSETPPAFIIHAGDDDAVPIANALLYYSSLADNKVPAEFHVYEIGGHGFGMLRGPRPADRWPELLEPWMKAHGWVK